MSQIQISSFTTKQLKLLKPQLKNKPINYMAIPISAPSIRMSGKMKIHKFSADNLSLSIEIQEEDVSQLQEIEEHIQNECENQKTEIAKIIQNSS